MFQLRVLGLLVFFPFLLGAQFSKPQEESIYWWNCDGITGEWCGWRPCLEARGVCVEGYYVDDLSSNMSGGVDTGGTQRFLLDINTTFDLACLVGLCGGKVYLDFYLQRGNDGSDKTGDIQAYSNIDSFDLNQLAEFWYEQAFCCGRWRVKLGKVDANSEFAYLENTGEFLNASMGFSPTIFVFPSYPDPATSVNIFYNCRDRFFVGAGVYDGSTQAGPRTGSRGLRNPFNDPAFLIAQAGAAWEAGPCCLAGRFTLGWWHHTGTFDRHDGGTNEGTCGSYATFDHDLWKYCHPCEDCTQRVALFLQAGYADPSVSEVTQHYGGGVIWEGAFTGRRVDVLGLGVTTAVLTDAAGAGFSENAETAVELVYRLELIPCASIKPDLQYIHNPGGNAALADAFVGTLRLEVAL